ncbi:MAG: hypothetical protein MUC86_03615 [Burkholderiaceae bacterium]|nr:hypothetical protein [Burkholderiaceae bacterium]
MAAAGFGWITVEFSRERRAWLRVGGGLSLALAIALAGGLAAEPSIGLALSALATLGAAGVATWWSVRPVSAWALYIGADGTIWGRMDVAADEPTAPLSLRPQVVGTRLVTLAAGRQVVTVWRDALPKAQFRRLCARARWHVERSEHATAPIPAATEHGN